METNSIQLLESFPLVSIIVPYYGPTHKWFILLSTFWRSSREMLDKNYKVFRRIMIKYWSEVAISDTRFLINFPPWDLLRLNFSKVQIRRNIVIL